MASVSSNAGLDMEALVSTDCDSPSSSVQSPKVPRPSRTLVRLTAGVTMVCALSACVVLTRPAESHPRRGAVGEKTELAMVPISSGSQVNQDAQASHLLPNYAPQENLHDGNVCDDNEELFGGLCYKKCALLTLGDAPIRTSSWTCCREHPCGLFNQRDSLGSHVVCNGYDVSGTGGCPHKPGACLLNEELYLGVCYQKCSLLTQGAYPHRVAAATCCKKGLLGCINPMNDRTRTAFNVGGGVGHYSAPHLPEVSLTEASAQQPASGSAKTLDQAHAAAIEAEEAKQRAAIMAALRK